MLPTWGPDPWLCGQLQPQAHPSTLFKSTVLTQRTLSGVRSSAKVSQQLCEKWLKAAFSHVFRFFNEFIKELTVSFKKLAWWVSVAEQMESTWHTVTEWLCERLPLVTVGNMFKHEQACLLQDETDSVSPATFLFWMTPWDCGLPFFLVGRGHGTLLATTSQAVNASAI